MDEERLAEIVEEQVEKSVAETSNKLLSDLDNMFSVRMGALQNDITVNQSVLATNQMVAINGLKLLQQPVFKKKGNQEQFKFNLRVQDAFEGVNSALEAPLTEMSLQKAKESSVKGIDLIKHRQKMIRLADQSDAGWSIVAEYESNELAEDSEDEKKIVKADARAVRKMKESRTKRSKRQTSGQGTAPYTTQRPSSNPVRFQATAGTRPPVRRGNCFGCGKPGHYRYECGAFAAVQNKISTNKISLTSICNNGVDGSTNLQTGDNRDSRAEVVDHGVNISPVGGLKQAYKVWEEAGAGVHILDVIEHGYKLPLYDTPPKSFCRNNKSAFDNSDFVASEIDNLLRKGCVSEVNEIPSIVNHLTVASNKLGKLRLVLDCRILNPFLLKFAFKLDDIQIAKQLFKCGDFLFTFDLKSAYHHIEIFPDHRTYLGFSWMQKGKVTYFVFNVLPFGVSTAAYIFTKLTRVFVAYLRGDGLDVAMYMDDGCGGARTLEEANMMSSRVRHDLVKFGLLIAEDKCIWVPNQKVTWLGHVLSMGDGMVFVTNARIKSLLDCLERMIRDIASGLNGVSVRTLAAIVGKIISMHMAIGPLVRLKTRFMYSCIELRANWDSQVLIDSNAFSELTFWSENVCALNGRSLYDKVVCNAVAFSDASATGFGGYLVANNEAEVTGEWTDEESSQSSTWRELEAVARVLNANKSCLFHKSVKWFTDNQNVVSILKFGSKVAHLQDIALNVYDNCHEAGVHLEPVWIPRGLNERADVLSKGGDCDDWSLSVEAFASLDMAFGPHSVDRFASEYNCKCARFNSRWWSSNSEGVDAFAQSWANENNLLVPPPRLASQSLIKLEVENACGTLVIPEWRSAPYWPRLFKGRNILRTFVKGYIVLDTGLSIVKGRGKNGVFGKRNVPFSMLAVRVCFGLGLDGRVMSLVDSSNPELLRLAGKLPDVLLNARSTNTTNKYSAYFAKWERFIKDKGHLNSIPGNPVHVALYLTSLIERNVSFSVISATFYSIKWAHGLAAEPDPTLHPFVVNVLESAKRSCSRPVVKKDPVKSETLLNLCIKYKDSNDLMVVRDLSMILISFCGFLRFNELSNLKCKDITIHSDYLSINISKSKTDQYRGGNQVLISKLSSPACPHSMLIKYLGLADIVLTSDIFLFRAIVRSSSTCRLRGINKPLSYTRVREVVLARLREINVHANFGLHSLRAGGATAAANASVLDRCWKRHGRWRSETAKDGYVADSVESRLQVTQNLGL